MQLDFIQFVRRLEAETRASGDLQGAMVRLLAWANRQQPHANWVEMVKFDAAAELDASRRWLRRVLAARPAALRASGAWFGLGEFRDENGVGFADLSVGLLGQYDADDSSGQWVHAQPSWYPEHSELESPALQRAGLLCNGPATGEAAPLAAAGNMVFSVAFAVLLLSRALDAGIFRSLGGKAPIGIATGFATGNFFLIGELTAKGFATNPRGFV